MKKSYLDYAMSVIVARALPDARDGLKPVHRRILYSMHENGYEWNKPYRKSARVVGDVIGKYHPHGDQAVYDALVRMAQDFSMRLPLIDGQGNFGSVDGDAPAAMRYTEVRLEKVAGSLVEDLDKDTVDFQANYDNSEREPVVMPARFPNLLVNGAGGIAVGMATNIPPHNLGEVIDACVALIDNPALAIEDLIAIVPVPIFRPAASFSAAPASAPPTISAAAPSSCAARSNSRAARRARGHHRLRNSLSGEQGALVERIGELVREKKIEGIAGTARRIRPRRLPRRGRAAARRGAGRGAQPALPFHGAAIVVRRQHGGARRRPAAGDEPEGPADLFIAFREEVIYRRTKHPARQGARPRPYPGRSRHRGRQYRRDDQADPRRAKTPTRRATQLMAREWPAT